MARKHSPETLEAYAQDINRLPDQKEAEVERRALQDIKVDVDLNSVIAGAIANDTCGWPETPQALTRAKQKVLFAICKIDGRARRDEIVLPSGKHYCR